MVPVPERAVAAAAAAAAAEPGPAATAHGAAGAGCTGQHVLSRRSLRASHLGCRLGRRSRAHILLCHEKTKAKGSNRGVLWRAQ